MPDPATAAAHAQRLWALREDPAQLKPIISALEAWVAAAPADPIPLILLSRATVWFAYNLETGGSREAKMALLSRGMEAGRKAVKLAPSNPGGEFWGVTNLGVYGKLKGVYESVSTYGEIRQRLERVEKLDPGYHYGGVWRYYGRLIDQVPGALRMVNGYDLDDALEFYRKALAVEPRYLQTHVNMAECFLQKGDRTQALQILTKAVQTNVASVPELTPENRFYQRKARAILKREFPESPLAK